MRQAGKGRTQHRRHPEQPELVQRRAAHDDGRARAAGRISPV
jgi:hypothetical protein